MTEEKRFEEILGELGALMLHLELFSFRVLLIGGQVLALESRQRGGTGVISIATDTGTMVDRGFSFEPDLLIDLDGTGPTDDQLPRILEQRGYKMLNRGFRWSKDLPGGPMRLDLFAPSEDVTSADLPMHMTLLPDSRLALRRRQRVELTIGGKTVGIHLPDAAGFLAMKERAKREQRPEKAKDSFDMFAYVKLVGPETVRASLQQASDVDPLLRDRLRQLFKDVSAPGPQDVITYAASLDTDEQELLAQAAVDLFAEL
ncbi:hypothetical protein [Corallococcus llansteffanensis]|uniref:Nucleotidyl transferase AbiEii/AbiGii toxin family protein n=1 Tax=Corallococcus llansteffanensis TaxID=2316731 RepID=A0A3A8PZL9_9BACT|nr:hypothetical protein [Corallococcus llansteffanensis]RKH61793.1 hypothetical protein D7V93_11200 [Corallococcus llansteffanensis]